VASRARSGGAAGRALARAQTRTLACGGDYAGQGISVFPLSADSGQRLQLGASGDQGLNGPSTSPGCGNHGKECSSLSGVCVLNLTETECQVADCETLGLQLSE
jgi:hypothetical protein